MLTEADKMRCVEGRWSSAQQALDSLIEASEVFHVPLTEYQQTILQNRLDRLSGKILEGLPRKAA